MICRQNKWSESTRGVIKQGTCANIGSADGINAHCSYLIAPRIACWADHVLVARALDATEYTRLRQTEVSLIGLANFHDRPRNAGWHENFDHDLVTVDHRGP